MRVLLSVVMATLLAVFATADTKAALVNSALVEGINDFNDDDIERLIKGEGNTGGEKIVEVGDVFEGILKFTQINGDDTPEAMFPLLGSAANDYQLTAYFQFIVTAKIPVLDADGDPTGNFIFFFGNALGDDGAGGFTHAVELYENDDAFLGSGERYSQTRPVANGISRATSGELLATLGLAAIDDFWWAPGVPDDLSVFEADEPLISGANAFFGISVITNPGGVAITTVADGGGIPTNTGPTGATTIHDIRGTTELKNMVPAEEAAGWHVRTDTTIQFVSVRDVSVIPEPSSLVIFGLGLAGMVGLAVRRERRRKDQEQAIAA